MVRRNTVETRTHVYKLYKQQLQLPKNANLYFTSIRKVELGVIIDSWVASEIGTQFVTPYHRTAPIQWTAPCDAATP